MGFLPVAKSALRLETIGNCVSPGESRGYVDLVSEGVLFLFWAACDGEAAGEWSTVCLRTFGAACDSTACSIPADFGVV